MTKDWTSHKIKPDERYSGLLQITANGGVVHKPKGFPQGDQQSFSVAATSQQKGT